MLACELGVTKRTIARWIKAGSLPQPKEFNRRLYWPRDEIEDWKRSPIVARKQDFSIPLGGKTSHSLNCAMGGQ
jgi:predicted DNA-binding transcriptional regulator AlpA